MNYFKQFKLGDGEIRQQAKARENNPSQTG
jgi:hypothetical protein